MKHDEEKLLDWVELGRHKPYRFYDHDEFNVKFVHADHPERYILINKQALAALANSVRRLAEKFTR